MRLLFYSDEPIVLDTIRLIFAQIRDIKLEKALNEASQVLPAVEEIKPDLLILSLTPDVNLRLLLQLRETAPDVRIVLWNRSFSREIAHQAIDLGIRGILPRTCSRELLLKCLYKVQQGELWFDRQLTASHLYCRRVELTPRQAQLAQMVAQGRNNREIATDLAISEGAVKVYLSHLFDKLGTRDRTELAHLVMRNVQSMEDGGYTCATRAPLRALYVNQEECKPAAAGSAPVIPLREAGLPWVRRSG